MSGGRPAVGRATVRGQGGGGSVSRPAWLLGNATVAMLEEENEQLWQALLSSLVIGVALGLLMERHHLPREKASVALGLVARTATRSCAMWPSRWLTPGDLPSRRTRRSATWRCSVADGSLPRPERRAVGSPGPPAGRCHWPGDSRMASRGTYLRLEVLLPLLAWSWTTRSPCSKPGPTFWVVTSRPSVPVAPSIPWLATTWMLLTKGLVPARS